MSITHTRDVDLSIMKQLRYSSLVNLCNTSKYYANLCRDEKLWQYLVKRDFGDIDKDKVTWKQTYLSKVLKPNEKILEKVIADLRINHRLIIHFKKGSREVLVNFAKKLTGYVNDLTMKDVHRFGDWIESKEILLNLLIGKILVVTKERNISPGSIYLYLIELNPYRQFIPLFPYTSSINIDDSIYKKYYGDWGIRSSQAEAFEGILNMLRNEHIPDIYENVDRLITRIREERGDNFTYQDVVEVTSEDPYFKPIIRRYISKDPILKTLLN